MDGVQQAKTECRQDPANLDRHRQQLAKLTVTELQLTNSVVLFTDMAMDLGVVLDGQLSYQCLTRWPLSVARVSSRYVS